ncbi:MAG: acyltransferase [Algoriphagus sp.]|uniref:acyltransferase n=1 Tax=Algoriphagus sp. TaxID=1872435 RepID=UPI00185EEF56|nr:acyltransferase [Algoriphagus sp.]NVJ85990.1 acyltransferase [Algoriphagus sp.]
MKVRLLIQVLFVFFPWFLRRRILNVFFGFKIHKTAYIGKSIILAYKLEMGEFSRIGSLTFCKNIDALVLGNYSRIGTLNYITGFSTRFKDFFSHRESRKCELLVGDHSAITSRHFIDCTDQIKIGRYTTVAGIRSQILTHSINLKENIQDCKPVEIGSYSFVGTNSVILPGSKFPDYCILGAHSVLNKDFEEEACLYGGVPAKKVKELEKDSYKYFSRLTGFVS